MAELFSWTTAAAALISLHESDYGTFDVFEGADNRFTHSSEDLSNLGRVDTSVSVRAHDLVICSLRISG
jgi:hypothetical protein